MILNDKKNKWYRQFILSISLFAIYLVYNDLIADYDGYILLLIPLIIYFIIIVLKFFFERKVLFRRNLKKYINEIYGIKPILLIIIVVLNIGSSNLCYGLNFKILLVLINASIVEEYIFRALMYEALCSKLNQMKAAFLTSLIFCVYHIVDNGFHWSYEQSLYIIIIFSVSLALQLIYAKTGIIGICIIFHLTFNVLGSINILNTSILNKIAMEIITILYVIFLLKKLKEKNI